MVFVLICFCARREKNRGPNNDPRPKRMLRKSLPTDRPQFIDGSLVEEVYRRKLYGREVYRVQSVEGSVGMINGSISTIVYDAPGIDFFFSERNHYISMVAAAGYSSF